MEFENNHNKKPHFQTPNNHRKFPDDDKEKEEQERDKLRRRLIWEQKNRKEIHK